MMFAYGIEIIVLQFVCCAHGGIPVRWLVLGCFGDRLNADRGALGKRDRLIKHNYTILNVTLEGHAVSR
jgi:hypothetical protein